MIITLASDEKYVQHLAASLASILVNTPTGIELRAYIISNDLSDASLEKLQALKSIRKVDVNVLPVDAGLFDGCSITRHTVNMYFRYHLPELLPSETRVIYLDCDTIVRGSLVPLWRFQLGSAPFAAAEDSLSLTGTPAERRKLRCVNGRYFNSGVLLMNLQSLRDSCAESRMVHWLRRARSAGVHLEYPDQDALNMLYGHEIRPLPIEWNFQYPLFEDTRFANVAPRILHFTTQNKPWKYTAEPKFKSEYWHYLGLTPWASTAVPEGRTVARALRKTLKATWFNSLRSPKSPW